MADIYIELKKHLPSVAKIDSAAEREILNAIFTEEEARLAMQLSATPEDIVDIAKKTGIAVNELEKKLERMADKGILYSLREKDKRKYKLMSVAWMMDSILIGKRGGQVTPEMRRVAELQPDYFMQGFADLAYNKPLAYARVVPLEDALPKDIEIYPWERISTIIESTDFWAVSDCPCRRSSELRKDGCGRPMHDICPFLGEMAHYLVERGMAKSITKDELYKIQEQAKEAGLVFTTNNAQEYIWICNCCGCCCIMLWGINRIYYLNALAKANFLSSVDPEQCIRCEICIEKCPVHSITLEGDNLIVKSTCLGCGVCVVSCPSEALKLKRRKEITIPPKTMAELQSIIKMPGISGALSQT